MKTAILFGAGVLMIVVFGGVWLLADARLDDLPADVNHFALQSERDTVEEVRSLAMSFVAGGAVIVALSGAVLAGC